jgi:senataxin
LFKEKGQLDTVIIDEAAQASELMSLLPFALNPKKVILVGDHKQLPATLFADNTDVTRTERSLFERLADGGRKVH